MSVHIKKAASDLICKSGCGYFGNPSWQGYCSKCWRDNNLRKAIPQVAAPSSVDVPAHKAVPSTVKTFTKFEEKKKKQTDKRKETVRSIFRKYNASEPSGSQSTTEIIGTAVPRKNQFMRRNSETTVQSAECLIAFLRSFNRDMGQDVSKYARNIVEQTDKLCNDNANVDVVSELIVSHYQSFEDRIKTHSLYRGITDDQLDKLLLLTEYYICTRIYRNVFAMPSTLDEEEDLKIQGRIRKFHWISSSHLDVFIDESKERVRNLLDEAINGIIEMDTVRAPRLKLDCISKCSKYIFELLHESKDSPISADDFLPALIYIVLRANPPLLKSNVMFITRFANPACLMTGMGAYNFTNLCCAVSFIENMTHDSLNLTSQQFDDTSDISFHRKIFDYMSGKLMSYDATCRINREHISNSEKNMKLFHALQSRMQALKQQNQDIIEDIMNMKKKILSEVEEVMTNNPCTIRPMKTSVRIDDELSVEATNLLPAPLLPTNVNDL